MRRIPSTRNLDGAVRQLDKAARETTKGITADMVKAAEALMRSQGAMPKDGESRPSPICPLI